MSQARSVRELVSGDLVRNWRTAIMWLHRRVIDQEFSDGPPQRVWLRAISLLDTLKYVVVDMVHAKRIRTEYELRS